MVYTTSITTPLYIYPEVRRSLNLTDEQIRRLNAANETLQGRFRTDFNRLSTLPEAERAARERELLRNYNTERMCSARDVFNAEQLRRYEQLGLQYRGYDAFTDPDIARRLNMTEAQTQRFRTLRERYNQELRDIEQTARAKRDDATRRYGELQRRTAQDVNALLNETQRRTWREMTGEPFPFPPPFDTSRR
jgi:hypothetical protein